MSRAFRASSARRGCLLAAAHAAVVLAIGALAPAAHGDMLAFVAPEVHALPGTTGSFDVLLVNKDTVAYDVSSYVFTLGVAPGSGVTFLDAQMNTSTPYIFSAPLTSFDALNAIPLSFDIPPGPATSFTASDSEGSIPELFAHLNPGDAVGLARVTFSVDPGAAPGTVVPLVFDITNTNASDSQNPPQLIPTQV